MDDEDLAGLADSGGAAGSVGSAPEAEADATPIMASAASPDTSSSTSSDPTAALAGSDGGSTLSQITASNMTMNSQMSGSGYSQSNWNNQMAQQAQSQKQDATTAAAALAKQKASQGMMAKIQGMIGGGSKGPAVQTPAAPTNNVITAAPAMQSAPTSVPQMHPITNNQLGAMSDVRSKTKITDGSDYINKFMNDIYENMKIRSKSKGSK